MAERWEGIVKAGCTGSKQLSRVMASVLFCSKTGTLQRPSCNAVLFMGDSVRGTGDPTIERLSQLENVSAILLSKLRDPFANTWIVEAPRFNGAFACYDGFLPSVSPQGDPLGYEPQDFPATRAITTLLQDSVAQVKQKFVHTGTVKYVGNQKIEGKSTEETIQSIPRTLLLGFSKGGVVLNQVLSEMAYLGQQINHQFSAEMVAMQQQLLYEGATLFPEMIPDFLTSISAIHYIDVGLNCPGAYLTDTNLLENVIKFLSSGSDVQIGLHGTSRQWNDRNRPWIASEKDDFIKSLTILAKRAGNDKVHIFEKLYFDGERPSLTMHFKILECFDMH